MEGEGKAPGAGRQGGSGSWWLLCVVCCCVLCWAVLLANLLVETRSGTSQNGPLLLHKKNKSYQQTAPMLRHVIILILSIQELFTCLNTIAEKLLYWPPFEGEKLYSSEEQDLARYSFV